MPFATLLIASMTLGDPLASHNAADCEALALLGDGIIVDAVEVGPVVRATDWLPLQPSSATYSRTAGTKDGHSETISILGISRPPGALVGSKKGRWSQEDPKSWTRYLQIADEGIRVPTSLNVPNVVTVFLIYNNEQRFGAVLQSVDT